MDTSNDLSKLCVHTITTGNWSVAQAASGYARAGVRGVTVWRDALTETTPAKAGDLFRRAGLTVVSLCRGGFFAHPDKASRERALEDNRAAIMQASELGAPLVVLVCGAHPKQSLEESRRQIAEGIQAVIPLASDLGVKLAIEPIHPMFADSRSAVNTLKQANDMADAINSPFVGVAIDVYHVWWDPELEREIARCGRNKKIFAYHISDWKTPTHDMLFDRGLMGEGCIPIRKISRWVEEAGFDGFHEVEIFSHLYWKEDPTKFIDKIVAAYKSHG